MSQSEFEKVWVVWELKVSRILFDKIIWKHESVEKLVLELDDFHGPVTVTNRGVLLPCRCCIASIFMRSKNDAIHPSQKRGSSEIVGTRYTYTCTLQRRTINGYGAVSMSAPISRLELVQFTGIKPERLGMFTRVFVSLAFPSSNPTVSIV